MVQRVGTQHIGAENGVGYGSAVRGADLHTVVRTQIDRCFRPGCLKICGQCRADFPVLFMAAGADSHIFQMAATAIEIIIHLTAAAVGIMESDVILFQKLAAAVGETAGDIVAIGCKHGGTEVTTHKLTVHDKLLQHRLTHLTKTDHKRLEILGSTSFFIKSDLIAGGIFQRQQPGCHLGNIDGGDKAIAVAFLCDLQSADCSILLGKNHQMQILRVSF